VRIKSTIAEELSNHEVKLEKTRDGSVARFGVEESDRVKSGEGEKKT